MEITVKVKPYLIWDGSVGIDLYVYDEAEESFVYLPNLNQKIYEAIGEGKAKVTIEAVS